MLRVILVSISAGLRQWETINAGKTTTVCFSGEKESLLPYPGVRGGQFHTNCSWPADLQFRLTRAKQAADRLAVIRQLGRQPTAVGSRQAKLQLVSPTRARNLDHLMCQLVFI